MSSKSSILLTKDNEHWYSDSSERLEKLDGTIVDAITLEFSKENIRIDINDQEDLVFTLVNPNAEVFEFLSQLAKDLRGY